MKLRNQLTISFVAVVLFLGLSSAFVGRYLIATQVVNEAERRVRSDLTVASDVLHDRLVDLQQLVNYVAVDRGVERAVINGDRSGILKDLIFTERHQNLQVLMILDEHGTVFVRANNPLRFGDSLEDDPLVRKGLDGQNYAAPQILSRRELLREGSSLAIRALRSTEDLSSRDKKVPGAGSGMMLRAVAPIWEEKGRLRGVVVGGTMVNGDFEITDTIKQMVFKGERYKGRDIGEVSLTQGPTRISTTVLTKSGRRAIGTKIDKAVYDDVFRKGKQWLRRAFSVNAWYLTAYEPVRDVEGKIIGVLGIGVLEDKYEDLKNLDVRIFLGLTLSGMVIALLVSYFLARNLTKPIRDLVAMAERVKKGDYESGSEVDLTMKRQGSEEIKGLTDSLSTMVRMILRQKWRNENIIQTMGEGIFVFDMEGRITVFNRAAEEITGFRDIEVKGKKFEEIFEGIAEFTKDLSFECGSARVGKKIREAWLKVREGKEVPVSINIVLLQDEEGEPLGGVCVFRDMTEERALEQLKKDFISTVTHDLKNPLVPVLGFSSRILEGKLGTVDTRVHDAAAIIYNSGKKVMNLIENFLSAAKIEDGRLELELCTVAVGEVVERLSRQMELQRREKKLDFETSIPDNLSPIRADKVQIERALGNLIGNAIKFTPAGGRIVVRARREEDCIRVEVEDSGIGIPKEQITTIFEKYKKVKGAGDGTGLGLYITRSIIEAHGGTIHVESTVGHGSCFSFSVPVDDVDGPAGG